MAEDLPALATESELPTTTRTFTTLEKKMILERASLGRPLKEIRDLLGLTQWEFNRIRDRDTSFSEALISARSEGLEELADSLVSIPEDIFEVDRARLKSENIKFILSKRKPQVYGDRVTLDVNQTVDISTALGEARKRIINLPDPTIIDAELVVEDPLELELKAWSVHQTNRKD